MDIHVTGSNGFLGGYVVSALEQLGDVHGTDVDTMGVMDPRVVMDSFRAKTPEVVVHLAALLGSAASRNRPIDTFTVNTVGTLNLLEACRQFGIGRFVFMSSITVHGKSDNEGLVSQLVEMSDVVVHMAAETHVARSTVKSLVRRVFPNLHRFGARQ